MALDDLLEGMVARDGTDLYLTVGRAPTLNAGGKYAAIGDGTPLTAEDVTALVKAALPASDLALFDRDGDANAAYALKDSDRFRVNALRQRGVPALELSARFIEALQEDLRGLGLLPPTHEPRVSDHVPEIIALIERLDGIEGLIIVEKPDGSLEDHASAGFRFEAAAR